MKTALITGASSGIGSACAEVLARNGYNLILNGRRRENLEILGDRLRKKFNVEVFIAEFDVRDKNMVFKHLEELPAIYENIDVLVNNAGLAMGLGNVFDADTNDWDQMIDTNLKGLMYVSRFVAARMKDRFTGHIINIGSIAARDIYEGGGVYCATKQGVKALSLAMRKELLPYNIKVTLLSPGAVETEFSLVRFKGDEDLAKDVYKGFQPLKAEDIAQCVAFCIGLPEHVAIDEMLVMPTAQAGVGLINRKHA